MKLKKLLVMPVVAISILMVGCQKDVGSSNTASTSSQVVLESMDNNINYETVPVPEGGRLRVGENDTHNGKPIEMPFTIDSLGDKYLANEEETIFWKRRCWNYSILIMFLFLQLLWKSK